MTDIQYFFTTATPTLFIELFIMIFVAFLIGYIGASISNRSKLKTLTKKHSKETKVLAYRIGELKKEIEYREELDKKEGVYLRKDRMNQDFEQLKIHKRAFSKDVINNKLPDKKEVPLNFDRIGRVNENDRDELQEISGIGPFTEIKLNELGIYTFKQISNFNDEDITIITQLIKFFPGRIKNDKWVPKAKNLCTQLETKNNLDKTSDLSKKEIIP